MLIVPALEYENLYRSVNAMLGVMNHFDAYHLSKLMFATEPILKHGYFSSDMTRYYLYRRQ